MQTPATEHCIAPNRSHIRLGPSIYAPRVARRTVFSLAAAAQIPQHLVDDTALVAAEIVTSAIRRTRAEIEFSVEVNADEVWLTVRDHHPRRPLLGRDSHAGSLRRTAIVDRLADSWGSRRRASGWETWAVLRADRPGRSRDRCALAAS